MAQKQQRTTGGHGPKIRREGEILRRLTEVEEVARANRRELELQFRRIADMQTQLDRLKKREN